ncbi:hypothetical protein I6B53_04270 [Schaalia sp. 19OD2882]|uniref:hypothetical protein n=1 Tax=Schaalia sp. 19OD2882 TaxID=2794089 RepID=UPI001C1EF7F1|nr:hypothetical protein [Schaalia sp. 19OD2882]QWW20312.1 hypothetical protein I6B53_04270 [Schaalia sp. 19OD2882]
MDLEMMFADLSSRFDAQRREEREGEIVDLADSERTRITLDMRIRAMRGAVLSLSLRGGGRLIGRVVDAARTWVLLDEGTGQSLIPMRAVVVAEPLRGVAGGDGAVSTGLTIGHALRELADMRARLRVDHDAGSHVGRIVAVYRDHLDLEVDRGGVDGDTRDVGERTVVAVHLEGLTRISVRGWA